MGNEGGHMLGSYNQFVQFLEKHPRTGFSYNADLVEQEGHNTTALVGHNLAYRQLYETLKCPKDIIAQGVPAIKQFYKAQSKQFGYEIKPSYYAINHAGYLALEQNKTAKAVKIFSDNLTNHSNKADAYDSLADGLKANGQLNEALNMMNMAIKKSMEENVENNAYKTKRDNLQTLINKGND